jgi:hypothetical protein
MHDQHDIYFFIDLPKKIYNVSAVYKIILNDCVFFFILLFDLVNESMFISVCMLLSNDVTYINTLVMMCAPV